MNKDKTLLQCTVLFRFEIFVLYNNINYWQKI